MINIVFLGLVSFFTDLSTEMVYPLIPLYLTSAFGATPAIVGVIEGIAESLLGRWQAYKMVLCDAYFYLLVINYICYREGNLVLVRRRFMDKIRDVIKTGQFALSYFFVFYIIMQYIIPKITKDRDYIKNESK